MNQESAAYLRKAEKALRAAEILLREHTGVNQRGFLSGSARSGIVL